MLSLWSRLENKLLSKFSIVKFTFKSIFLLILENISVDIIVLDFGVTTRITGEKFP